MVERRGGDGVPWQPGDPIVYSWVIRPDDSCKTEYKAESSRVLYKKLVQIFAHPEDSFSRADAADGDGAWFIRTKSDRDFSTLTKLGDYTVKTVKNTRLSTSRGLIFSSHFKYLTKEEILEELEEERVINVFKITNYYNQKETETGKVVLTFDVPVRPEKIKLKMLRLSLNVEEYIPKPRRCTNCQSFAHVKKYCSAPAVCARCGKEHETITCKEEELKCINCNHRGHGAWSRDCEVYRKEEKVEEIRERGKLSYKQARYELSKQANRKTFASIAAPSPVVRHSDQEVETLKNCVKDLTKRIEVLSNLVITLMKSRDIIVDDTVGVDQSDNMMEDSGESSTNNGDQSKRKLSVQDADVSSNKLLAAACSMGGNISVFPQSSIPPIQPTRSSRGSMSSQHRKFMSRNSQTWSTKGSYDSANGPG